MSTDPVAVAPADAPKAAVDVRPYIIKTYDRWIILALVLLAGWLLFRPLFAFSVYYRGVSFEHMLRLRVAEHYYRKAISVDPKIPEGWLGLGQLQMMHARSDPSEYANTIDTFTRGLSNNPKSGVLAFSLCRAYYEIGKDYPRALAACQLGFQNDDSNRFAWDYAAWASLHVGKREQALQYWHEALRRGHSPAAAFIKRYSKSG
jgi:tetratricopeptide (TPR) repeat protein